MGQKRKILFLSTKSVFGGAQRYIIDLVDYLPKDSYESIVAAGGRGGLAHEIIKRNVPYYEIKNMGRDIGLLSDVRAFFEIRKLIKKTRPDILHLNSSKASLLGAIAGRIGGVPHIVSSTHGWPFLEDRPHWQKTFLKLILKVESYFLDAIICVSDFDYTMGVQAHIAPRKKLIQIHNGVDAARHVFLEPTAAREKLSAKTKTDLKNRFIIGTIAEYTKNKGLLYLIEAAIHIKTIEPRALFFIIGGGEEKAFLENQIEKHGLTQNVILADHVPEAFSYLKAFDLFILPSIKEGFAYVLLEASLAELAIVTTRVGGNPEVIENFTTGLLIEPALPQEIINAIVHLIKTPEDRTSFGKAARTKVLRDFSIDTMIKKTIAAYER